MDASSVSLISLGIEDHAVIGALLERQTDSLEAGRWKEDVQVVVPHLLRDTLEIYGLHMPLRRARALLRCLEFMYHAGPEHMMHVGAPEYLAHDIIELLQRQVS